MKAISLKRPAAHAIVHGPIRLINRRYPPHESIAGQWIALHSSKAYSDPIADVMSSYGIYTPDYSHTPDGIVGLVKIGKKATTDESLEFFKGPVAWVIEDVRAVIPPLRISGSLGMWEVPSYVMEMLRKNWHQYPPGAYECTEKRGAFDEPTPSIRETPVTVIDVETTGLSMTDEIIEIACLEMYDGRLIDQFTMMCNPKKDIPKNVEKLTGIYNIAARQCPPVRHANKPMTIMMNRARYVLGHNIRFDMRYLSRQLKTGLWNGNAVVIDSMEIARKKGEKKKSLDALKEKYEVKIDGHRAKNDCLATYFVTCHLMGDDPIIPTMNLSQALSSAEIQREGKIDENRMLAR